MAWGVTRIAVPSSRAALRWLPVFELIIVMVLMATAVAIIFRDPLTKETLILGPEGAGIGYFAYAYDDHGEGGSSTTTIEPGLGWKCMLSDAYRYRYCGFGIAMAGAEKGQGIDLARFDSLKVTIDYEGRAEYLRIVLKNHDDRYGLIGQAAADKPNQATITIASAERTVPLELSDFTVAEWWKDVAQLPPEKIRPEFGNVTAI